MIFKCHNQSDWRNLTHQTCVFEEVKKLLFFYFSFFMLCKHMIEAARIMLPPHHSGEAVETVAHFS